MFSKSPNIRQNLRISIPSSIYDNHTLGHAVIANIGAVIDSLWRPLFCLLQFCPLETGLRKVQNPGLIKTLCALRPSKEYHIGLRVNQRVSVSLSWLVAFSCDFLPVHFLSIEFSQIKRLWCKSPSHKGPAEQKHLIFIHFANRMGRSVRRYVSRVFLTYFKLSATLRCPF